nr:hypothetical protein [Tanacetum cinerariifolium]
HDKRHHQAPPAGRAVGQRRHRNARQPESRAHCARPGRLIRQPARLKDAPPLPPARQELQQALRSGGAHHGGQ